MRWNTGLLLLIAMPMTAPLVASAETAYVTDNLRLGLHHAADTSDRAFRTLESGQQVEILTQDRYYAQVRLPDGTVGYLKSAYLVSEKPAVLIVAETEAERARLVEELAKVREQFAGPAATIAALEQQVADLNATIEEQRARVAELAEDNERLVARQEQYQYSLPIPWVGGALAVCLFAGFVGGLWWIDFRSRRRHGGMRIY